MLSCGMADRAPPDPPREAGPVPERPSLARRLQPWAELVYKLLIAAGAALALWKGL